MLQSILCTPALRRKLLANVFISQLALTHNWMFSYSCPGIVLAVYRVFMFELGTLTFLLIRAAEANKMTCQRW